MKSLQEHKHTLDIKIRKNGTAKTYAKAQCLIHTEEIKETARKLSGL